jgi:hypothetical protein
LIRRNQPIRTRFDASTGTALPKDKAVLLCNKSGEQNRGGPHHWVMISISDLFSWHRDYRNSNLEMEKASPA